MSFQHPCCIAFGSNSISKLFMHHLRRRSNLIRGKCQPVTLGIGKGAAPLADPGTACTSTLMMHNTGTSVTVAGASW